MLSLQLFFSLSTLDMCVCVFSMSALNVTQSEKRIMARAINIKKQLKQKAEQQYKSDRQ